MNKPIFGRWEIGDPNDTGYLHPLVVEGWKFIDHNGLIAIFKAKKSALETPKAWKNTAKITISSYQFERNKR